MLESSLSTGSCSMPWMYSHGRLHRPIGSPELKPQVCVMVQGVGKSDESWYWEARSGRNLTKDNVQSGVGLYSTGR